MGKAKLIFASLIFIYLACARAYAEPQVLFNTLGAGANPRLHIELSPDNGPKWEPFSIDYRGMGNIPWSKTPGNDASPWIVKDEQGNYYGTITLHSDGEKVTFDEKKDYVVDKLQGFYLEGIHLTFNPDWQIKYFQLSSDKVHITNVGPLANTPPAQPAVYSGTTDIVVLLTDGTRIINDHGKAIILKGMTRPSLEWNEQGENLSAYDIQKMRAWGANVVRINLNQEYWFKSAPAALRGSYKQIINALVYNAIQNDMAVILVLRTVGRGKSIDMANRESLQFWKEVATDYKNFGTVMFELFSKPANIQPATWLDGNELFAGYQQLYNAVRSVGADNICIVDGLDWGYDLSFVNNGFKVAGTNVVYGAQPYNNKGDKKYKGPGGSLDQNFQGIFGNNPILITEFGVNIFAYYPKGYETIYRNFISYASTHGIGYVAYAWWVEPKMNNADIFPTLIKDWGGEPLNGGEIVMQNMLALPGSQVDAP
jgi:hypothetical protein